MEFSEKNSSILKALFEAQKSFKPLKKDAYNPRFKSNYTSLEAIWDSIREALIENELLVVQDVTAGEKYVDVTTRFFHIKSSEWMQCGPLRIYTANIDAQASGSAITYAKKYSLCAALGLVTGDHDDDGNSATTPAVVKKISKEAVKEIESLLTGSDELRTEILEKLKIASFESLDASKYLGVIKRIRERLKEVSHEGC